MSDPDLTELHNRKTKEFIMSTTREVIIAGGGYATLMTILESLVLGHMLVLQDAFKLQSNVRLRHGRGSGVQGDRTIHGATERQDMSTWGEDYTHVCPNCGKAITVDTARARFCADCYAKAGETVTMSIRPATSEEREAAATNENTEPTITIINPTE